MRRYLTGVVMVVSGILAAFAPLAMASEAPAVPDPTIVQIGVSNVHDFLLTNRPTPASTGFSAQQFVFTSSGINYLAWDDLGSGAEFDLVIGITQGHDHAAFSGVYWWTVAETATAPLALAWSLPAMEPFDGEVHGSTLTFHISRLPTDPGVYVLNIAKFVVDDVGVDMPEAASIRVAFTMDQWTDNSGLRAAIDGAHAGQNEGLIQRLASWGKGDLAHPDWRELSMKERVALSMLQSMFTHHDREDGHWRYVNSSSSDDVARAHQVLLGDTEDVSSVIARADRKGLCNNWANAFGHILRLAGFTDTHAAGTDLVYHSFDARAGDTLVSGVNAKAFDSQYGNVWLCDTPNLATVGNTTSTAQANRWAFNSHFFWRLNVAGTSSSLPRARYLDPTLGRTWTGDARTYAGADADMDVSAPYWEPAKDEWIDDPVGYWFLRAGAGISDPQPGTTLFLHGGLYRIECILTGAANHRTAFGGWKLSLPTMSGTCGITMQIQTGSVVTENATPTFSTTLRADNATVRDLDVTFNLQSSQNISVDVPVLLLSGSHVVGHGYGTPSASGVARHFTKNLVTGSNVFHITIPGDQIRQSGISGPYQLAYAVRTGTLAPTPEGTQSNPVNISAEFVSVNLQPTSQSDSTPIPLIRNMVSTPSYASWQFAGTLSADVGKQGGEPGSDGALNNNDWVVFMNLFFAHDPRADLGMQGGVFGSDGVWDNNDLVAFTNLFFAGIP